MTQILLSGVPLSQTQGVLALLQRRKGGVTAWDIMIAGYGMRAAARIADLRAAGHSITTTMVETDGHRVARYRLGK